MITYHLLQKEKPELFRVEHTLNSSALIDNGGGEESRTPVRKVLTTVFYERSCCIKIPLTRRPATDFVLR